jgi:ketosteroid isomerase-like protein
MLLGMYQRLIARNVRSRFALLSTGDYATVLLGVDENVHHRFAGQHPLGGERHDKRAVQLWFERLYRLFPNLVFDVRTVVARGWPWDLTVAAQWSAVVTPARGPDYANSGVHVIRIRRGKVVALYAYEDSQAVAQACRTMAELGVAEAAAPPITS